MGRFFEAPEERLEVVAARIQTELFERPLRDLPGAARHLPCPEVHVSAPGRIEGPARLFSRDRSSRLLGGRGERIDAQAVRHLPALLDEERLPAVEGDGARRTRLRARLTAGGIGGSFRIERSRSECDQGVSGPRGLPVARAHEEPTVRQHRPRGALDAAARVVSPRTVVKPCVVSSCQRISPEPGSKA